MQSDRDFDNYTNSELGLKSRIGTHDNCISNLLLEYERTATYTISYSMRRYFCSGSLSKLPAIVFT